MSVTLQARIEQKIDTLPNWNANTLVLLKGEQAFVIDADGVSIMTFKIGDGTKTFSQLPWPNFIIAYDVPTYADMIAKGTPLLALFMYSVLEDEDKGIENSLYLVNKNGNRRWIAEVDDN